MNDEFYDDQAFHHTRGPASSPDGGHSWLPGGGTGWFDSLRHLWQWDELAAEIGQESQSRVAFVGLTGAGKSLLFNRLRGWVVSEANPAEKGIAQFQLQSDLMLESLGLFILVDLPADHAAATHGLLGADLLLSLGDPALVVYLLDGQAGVRPGDFRWVAALRACGKPLIVALNKIDLAPDAVSLAADASRKLGMPVICLSAETGANVEEGLLPAMLDAVPRLAVPLGREIASLRRVAARRVIRQAAILSGLMGAQPVPMLDIPLQAMVQVGVVMRVGAAYGYTPTGGMNREVMGAVVSTLGLRYLVLALVKLIPFVGWLVSSLLCALMTYLLGEAAIRYYEAGAKAPLRDFLRLSGMRHWLGQKRQAARRRVRRPRWVRARSASQEIEAEDEIIPVMTETAVVPQGAGPTAGAGESSPTIGETLEIPVVKEIMG